MAKPAENFERFVLGLLASLLAGIIVYNVTKPHWELLEKQED